MVCVGDVHAGVLAGAKGHHLHDRHGDVGPGRLRLITPAAVGALAADDELGRFLHGGLSDSSPVWP